MMKRCSSCTFDFIRCDDKSVSNWKKEQVQRGAVCVCVYVWCACIRASCNVCLWFLSSTTGSTHRQVGGVIEPSLLLQHILPFLALLRFIPVVNVQECKISDCRARERHVEGTTMEAVRFSTRKSTGKQLSTCKCVHVVPDNEGNFLVLTKKVQQI